MTNRPPSAFGIFIFLMRRTTANMVQRRLKRLREPRYVVGVIMGAAYFYFAFFRSAMRGSSARSYTVPAAVATEASPFLLLGASLVLAMGAIAAWLFIKGTPQLDLKEADVQFLVPAPLPPRTVVHFSLLRSQIALIFSSLIVAFFFGRGISPHAWHRAAVSWLVLSTLSLHAMGLTFSKASWDEMAPGRRRLAHVISKGLVIVMAVSLIGWIVDGVRLVIATTSGADMSRFSSVIEGVRPALNSTAMSAWSNGVVPRVLLAPFSALLAPVFASEPAAFLPTLPAAFAVLLLHYFWVVRVSARYEEAAVAGAQRSAERAIRRSRGEIAGPAPASRRDVVPFHLGSEGIPEIAVVWKNLLSRSRFRLRSTAFGLITTWVALFALVAARGATPVGSTLSLVMVMVLAFLAPLLTLTLPIGIRIDFRSDLERASVLRGWPLSANRLVIAELATPLIVTMIWIWGFLGGLLAILGGRQWALAHQTVAAVSSASPFGHGVGAAFVTYGIPGALGLALFLPALAAAVLVVQNGAVLAWPDWFPPGRKRARGFEATGSRVISMFGTLLIALVGLIPAALIAAVVAAIGWNWIGAWVIVPAALLASVPVWAEAFAGTLVLGRLFESFDVSAELVE
jgi:hypothetical protein